MPTHGEGSAEQQDQEPGRAPREVARHYGPVPSVNMDTWRLTVGGETADGGMRAFAWDEIAALPRRIITAAVTCGEAGAGPVGRWGGVPTSEIVRLAPPAPAARFVLAAAAYGFTSSLRVIDLMAEDTLLAFDLDGEPLPPEHGGPLRLLAPHLFGWKSVKWLLDLSYRSVPEPGFWESRGYHMTGRISDRFLYAHQG